MIVRYRPGLEVGILELGDLDVDEHLDVGEQRALLGRDQRPRDAVAARTRRAPDPVHVHLHVLGQVVVDHVGDAVDVEPSAGQVRGDQHRQLAVVHLLHDGVAFGLGQVAVDPVRLDASLRQITDQLIDAALEATEHERQVRLLVREQVLEQPALVPRLHGQVELPHLCHGERPAGGDDLLGVAHV